MQFLTSNVPTLVMLALQLAVYLLQNRGVITPDQAMGLMGTLATLGVAGAQRMPPPPPLSIRKPAAVALVALLGLLGCGAAKERPACSPVELARIEANYIADAQAACAGESFESCPALPGIRDKYDALRKEWVDCQ